ncbi:TetR/AcrR family transcriptional regulator [Ectothiorhodospiraceae bacterium WFHF3C12]|nr:TetR/AcrR family transcriptional regulator [Ectothiorhodospiraceae bacterium WFHF3C12]
MKAGTEQTGDNTDHQGRRRLTPAEREKQIVDGAIRFFAEVGFEGQTRELAKRLGITQPLLYRYFPSKDSLIERVYLEVFVKRWQPGWDVLIVDRSRSLHDRLTQFYREYTRAIFNYEWVRIFMFAGLKGVNINERYLGIVREKLLRPVCTELREMAGLPSPEVVPLTEEELELAWDLHGGMYYMGIRQWIYHLSVPDDLDGHIDRVVGTFLRGAPETLREHFPSLAPNAPSSSGAN